MKVFSSPLLVTKLIDHHWRHSFAYSSIKMNSNSTLIVWLHQTHQVGNGVWVYRKYPLKLLRRTNQKVCLIALTPAFSEIGGGPVVPLELSGIGTLLHWQSANSIGSIYDMFSCILSWFAMSAACILSCKETVEYEYETNPAQHSASCQDGSTSSPRWESQPSLLSLCFTQIR